MIQTFNIVAVVGFSLAAVLAACAVVMFFALRVKDVRDELTGKTAARSIAEIRSRAKTRKRSASQAAQRLGWSAGVSSGDLSDFADAEAWRDTAELPDGARAASALDEEGATTFLSDDEGGTTVLAGDGWQAVMWNAGGAGAGDPSGEPQDDDADDGFDGPATTLLAGDADDAGGPQDDEDDGPATTLLSHDDATASTGGAR